MISCASTNAMIRVLKNSQTLRPIFRQFGFRKVSTFAYHSVLVDVSQFAPASCGYIAKFGINLSDTTPSPRRQDENLGRGTRRAAKERLSYGSRPRGAR